LVAILAIFECTGASMKEICLLTESDFHIDGVDHPFITIGPNKYRKFVKTGKSRHRDLSLLGKALEAAKKYAKAFPGMPVPVVLKLFQRRQTANQACSTGGNHLLIPPPHGGPSAQLRMRGHDEEFSAGAPFTGNEQAIRRRIRHAQQAQGIEEGACPCREETEAREEPNP
jgi:hypothetical protein